MNNVLSRPPVKCSDDSNQIILANLARNCGSCEGQDIENLLASGKIVKTINKGSCDQLPIAWNFLWFIGVKRFCRS